jgi:hypothetical protein
MLIIRGVSGRKGNFLCLLWQYCRWPWSFTCEPCSFDNGRTCFVWVRRVWNGSADPKSSLGRRQCCHNKQNKFPYRPTGDVSFLSGQEVKLTRNKSRRLRGRKKCWNFIIALIFGPTRTATLSHLHAGCILLQGNNVVLISEWIPGLLNADRRNRTRNPRFVTLCLKQPAPLNPPPPGDDNT